MLKKPLIIAHRGARKYAPENTMPAFRKVLELDCVDGVEFDTLLTKDKVPVISHSNDLSELTATHSFIHDLTYKELQDVDAGSHFHPDFTGEKIPKLASVLELYANTNLLIDIEIKVQPRWHIGVEKIVADMIYYYALEERTIVSSFNPIILWRLAKIAPRIKRAFITEPHAFFFLRTYFFAKILKVSGLHPHIKATKRDLIDFARRAGWWVYLWTPNTSEEMKYAIELGADGIITDNPLQLKEIIECQTPNQTTKKKMILNGKRQI